MDNAQSYHMDRPARYRIRLHGYVSEWWANRQCEMTTRVFLSVNGHTETELTGLVKDQAALVGQINLLYDLGHAIETVERLEPDEPSNPSVEG